MEWINSWAVEVFPKWNRNSVNSENPKDYWSMNRGEFKGLYGAEVDCWFVTQETVGSSTIFMKNISQIL